MNIEILFNEQVHEYLVNNVKAKTSVTALIERQVSKTNFAGVDPVVLANAAARGTKVHKELELWIKDGNESLTTPEAQNFKDYIIANNWKFVDHLAEFKLAIVWTSRNNPNNSFVLAGTADLITRLVTKDFDEPIVADHKTTSVVHTQDVRWQLSLLDYMARHMSGNTVNGQPFNYQAANKLFVFHFNKSAEFNPIEVEKISDIEIERLLDAEADGEDYYPLPQEIITPRQQEELLSLEQQIVQLEQSKKALEERKKRLSTSLIEGFRLHTDVTSIKTNSFTISYIAPKTTISFDEERFISENPEEATKYQKTSFDAKAFIESNPDLANQYQHSITSKPSVRITLAKELKENIPILATAASSGQLTISSPPQKQKRTKATKDYFN